MREYGKAHAGMRVGNISAFLAKESGGEVDYAPLCLAGHSFECGLAAFEKEQLVDLGHGLSPARAVWGS